MEELAKTTEQPQQSSFWRGVWFPAVFGFSSSIFRNYFSLLVAWILAGILASCVNYVTLPKPRVGIVRYFVIMLGCLLITLSTLWFIPPILQTFMSAFWSYALPMLLLFNAIYFVPPLDGSERDTAWWKWFLGSLVFAVLFGWFWAT